MGVDETSAVQRTRCEDVGHLADSRRVGRLRGHPSGPVGTGHRPRGVDLRLHSAFPSEPHRDANAPPSLPVPHGPQVVPRREPITSVIPSGREARPRVLHPHIVGHSLGPEQGQRSVIARDRCPGRHEHLRNLTRWGVRYTCGGILAPNESPTRDRLKGSDVQENRLIGGLGRDGSGR